MPVLTEWRMGFRAFSPEILTLDVARARVQTAIDRAIREAESGQTEGMNSMDETTDVIVIGAGLAGLAAARDLSRLGFSVLMLEKSKGVSGRAATKRLEVAGQPIRADHGAQFFTVRGQRLSAILPKFLEAGISFEWTRGFPRWTSGGLGQREPGHPRYACADGMSALGKAFAKGWEPGDSAPEVDTEALVRSEERRVGKEC